MRLKLACKSAHKEMCFLTYFYWYRFIINPLFFIPVLFSLLIILYYKYGFIPTLAIVLVIIIGALYKRDTFLIKNVFIALLLVFISVNISSIRKNAQINQAKKIINEGQIKEYEIWVHTSIKTKGDSQSTFAKINGANAYISLPRYPELSAGIKCAYKGNLKLVDHGNEVNGFSKYLINSNTYLSGVGEINSCRKQRNGVFAIYYLYDFKERFTGYLEERMLEPYVSLFVGIIFGDDRVFTPEFEKVIQIAGVSHVVAASGYNIQFVIEIGRKVFGLLGSKYKQLLLVSVILLYAFVAGLGASVIRAALSGVIYILAALMKYPLSRYFNLPIVILVMLFVNPLFLFDIGFQLSVLASIAIIYITPVFQYRFKIGKIFVVPILCTILTAPILTGNFSKFSLIAPLASVLALWSVEDVMYLGLFIGISSFICEEISLVLIRIGESLIWMFVKIVEILSNLPFSQYQLQPIVISLLILVMAALFVALLPMVITDE